MTTRAWEDDLDRLLDEFHDESFNCGAWTNEADESERYEAVADRCDAARELLTTHIRKLIEEARTKATAAALAAQTGDALDLLGDVATLMDYKRRWVCRDSEHGRGLRLHQTTATADRNGIPTEETPRAAVVAFLRREGVAAFVCRPGDIEAEP